MQQRAGLCLSCCLVLLLGAAWMAGWLAGRRAVAVDVEPSPVSLAPGSAAPPTLFQLLCADGLTTDGELMRK